MPSELLYRIVDEPSPNPIRKWAVKPFWPWIAYLMSGGWIGIPWFIFNSVAMGSPTRNREIGLALLTPVILLGMVLGLNFVMPENAPAGAGRYLVVVFLLVKMVVSYVLFIWQSRGIQLHEHFGNRPQNGAIVAVVAFMIDERVTQLLPQFLRLGLM